MSVSFRILPRFALAYIRYNGRMGIAESTEALGRFVTHPDYRKGMKQLVDLTAVTDWERDFAGLMRHQAREAEVYDDPIRPALVVCLAPTEIARTVANLVSRAWEHSQHLVPIVVTTETEALAVLGLDANALAEVLDAE